MADIITRCCICEADFRPGSLDKAGKCVVCREKYPTVKNKQEAMALNQPNIHLGEKVTAEMVRQIIKEELNGFKAELEADKVKAGKAEAAARARAAREAKTEEAK